MTAGSVMKEAVARSVGRESPEERVFRQLLEAFVFEGIVPLKSLEFGPVDRASGFAPVEMEIAGRQVRFDARIGAFDRFEIRKRSAVEVASGKPPGVEAACSLIDATDANPGRKSALKDELRHTVRLCEWNDLHLKTDGWDRRSLAYEELDPNLHEGHPYHPCFKARTGFSEEDHRSYGPEAGKSFELMWLAVRRDHLRTELPCEEQAFWIQEIGDGAFEDLLERLQASQAGFETYGLLPVHPWQWRAIESRYRVELDSRVIVPLGTCGDRFRATQSLRTLMNDSDPAKAHLKLPMSLVNTSSLRTFEASLVATAPHVSGWLDCVVQGDGVLRGAAQLVILKEYAAALYQPVDGDDSKRGELGCIWRQSIQSVLRPGEGAVPFNALSLVEGDGLPFIDPWIQRFGLERWLWRLLEATIPPIWRLLVRHGIAIEAHAQNLVLIHQDGWPLRIAARDFHESIEYVESYLGDTSHLLPDFTAIDPIVGEAPLDRFYRMGSVEALRELFMDTVFIYNLVDLERLLRSEYGFSESVFWSIAGKFMTEHAEGATRNGRADAIGHRASRLRTESLMRKKLFGGRADEFHHGVGNPFHTY